MTCSKCKSSEVEICAENGQFWWHCLDCDYVELAEVSK